MREKSTTTVPSTSREPTEKIQELLRQMAEERDLLGLAAVAETSLKSLRQLVERPVNCSDLDLILEKLEGLSLDAWELEEE